MEGHTIQIERKINGFYGGYEDDQESLILMKNPVGVDAEGKCLSYSAAFP